MKVEEVVIAGDDNGEVIKGCDDNKGSRADDCVLSRNGNMAVSVCFAGTRILLYNVAKYCDVHVASPREPIMSNSIDAVEHPRVLFCEKGKIRQKGNVDVVL
jgi:hypothetical protein